jgi:penicillin amidase
MTTAVLPPARRGRRVLRVALVLLGALAVAAAGLALWGRAELAASLPLLEGERAVRGLGAPVRVERDALGVPRIIGQSRLDVARATGFVHAQDRFFQMDLLRRRAAGELAELFGAAALDIDMKTRVHRFRHVAEREAQAARPVDKAIIEAYTSGVNEGLAGLHTSPFEYLLLRIAPKPWKPEDTILVALAMYLDLQGEDAQAESSLGVLHDTLPPEVFAFLAPPGTEWDVPLTGDPFPPPSSTFANRRPSRFPRPLRSAGSTSRSSAATTGRSRGHTPSTAAPSWPTTCTSGSESRTPGTARRSNGRIRLIRASPTR